MHHLGEYAVHPSKLAAMKGSTNWPVLLLVGAVLCILLNLLLLPMLPTSDGAMHAYYAQVFAHLLEGHSIYSHSYAIRSIFPPYAFHFYLLIGLSRFFSPYLTERIIACLVIIWTFTGFYRLSSALGKNGIWSCFFVLPFLANWPLYMGFTNFAFGTATLLFAVGYWLDHIDAFSTKQALVTIALVCALASQHPVSLFLFFVFVGIELVSNYFLAPRKPADPWNRRLVSYLRTRELPIMLIFALGLLVLFWIRAFVKTGALQMVPPPVVVIAKRIVSLITLNEISPFSLDWWLYTVALLSVAVPAAVFAFRYWRSRRRDPRVFVIALLLIFCLATYLMLPEKVNGADHAHKRFSITAIFLILALGSAAPMTLFTRRAMMVVALIATAVTTGLQAKANRKNIALITPSIKNCLVPPASRLLVARFGTAIYGHPLRYELDDAAPAYWAARCQAIFVNSLWLSQAYYPLRTANGAPTDISENFAGLAIQRAVHSSLPLPLPYAPDVIAVESFDGGKQEKALITGLEKLYNFSPFPGVNKNYIYLFRVQPSIRKPSTQFRR
jgi:hypothetical protein